MGAPIAPSPIVTAMADGNRIDPLFAALADAEVVRARLSELSARLDESERAAARLLSELEFLQRRLGATDDRQRELHVLLLHRDEEIARLHEQLSMPGREAPKRSPSSSPSLSSAALGKPARLGSSATRQPPPELRVSRWIQRRLLRPALERVRRASR